jgi:hypothetical protein
MGENRFLLASHRLLEHHQPPGSPQLQLRVWPHCLQEQEQEHEQAVFGLLALVFVCFVCLFLSAARCKFCVLQVYNANAKPPGIWYLI